MIQDKGNNQGTISKRTFVQHPSADGSSHPIDNYMKTRLNIGHIIILVFCLTFIYFILIAFWTPISP